MYVLLTLGFTPFLICFLLTPLCRDLALRYKLVDRPDQDRKRHGRDIPRLGGVAIVIAYAVSLAIGYAFAPPGQKLYIQHQQLLWSLLPAAAVVFLTGLLDDLVGLKPSQKLLGQFIGAGAAVIMGTRFTATHSRFFAHHPALASPWLIYPMSFLWLIGCTNAVNLIDGLDGLASGVGLFATVATLLVAAFTGNTGLLLATLPLVGCLLAFLCFNFNPASIFLGDCGSLTIGFALGCFALIWSQRGGSMMGLVAPLMVLALPLIDVGLAISRRSLRSVPIFKADRGHIHHMVLARGHHPRTAALILYGVCAIAALLALMLSFSPGYLRVAVIAIFLLLAFAGIDYLDYIELGAARRAVSHKQVLRQVREEIYLRELERSILNAPSAEACWTVVRSVCTEMRVDKVEMLLEGVHFEDGSTPGEEACLRLTLPLGEHGYLKVSRGGSKTSKLMMSAVETVQESLTKRAAAVSSGSYIVSRAVRSAVLKTQDGPGTV